MRYSNSPSFSVFARLDGSHETASMDPKRRLYRTYTYQAGG